MTMDFDLQRFAIKNTESNTFVMGTVFDDSINNTGSNVTINSDVGDDSIISYGNNVWIDSGVGDDSVHNDGSNVTIYANVGDDTILTHNGSNVLINCSTGDDSVSNFDSKVTIFGETGDDSIHLNSNTQDNMVDAGIGDDYILSFSDNSTLLGGIGDDTIKTGAKAYSTSNDSLQAEDVSKYVFIDGGRGDDSIASRGSYATLSGGIGNDFVWSSSYDEAGKNVSMSGGDGNDSIFSNGENATISGDLGNDFVSLSSVATNNLIIYNPGDGNDTIRGINASSTLRIGNGKSSYSSTTSGSNVIVTVGKGKITLEGAKGIDFTIQGNIPSPKKINNSSNNTLLTGSTFNDTITNSGGNVTINAGGGNDSITLLYGTTLESNKVTVDAGGGADTVLAKGNYLSVVGGGGRDSINGHHNYGTIKAGADNDTIVGNHYRSKLYGDSGNDLINITSYWYDTISGGTGNDTIAVEGGGNHSISGGKGADRVSLGSATSSTIYYAQGDGNDTVWGFDSTDVLSINGSYTNKKSENDVIVTVGNSKITFKDAAKLGTMTINNKTIKIGGEEEKVTQQDVIKTFMATLDKYGSSSAKTALDKAVDAVSNYKTINEAITAMVNDCKYAASSDDFLKNKCGIDLDNYDTGAITGSDAGGTLKTAKSIIPESGTKQSLGSDYIAYYVWYDDKNSGAVINYKDVGNVTKDKQHIMDCMYTWWSSEALKLIEESYGYSFNDSNAKYKVIYLQFADNADYRAANGYYGNDQKLIINLGCYNNLASDDYDAESPNGQGYLDRTFTHELTHAIMRSKLENFSSLPQFIKEGVADLTHGSDDDRGSYMEDLAGNSDYLASKLKVSDNSTGDNPTYAAGYMFLRWLAKQNATINDSSSASAITATQKKIPKGISVKNSTMTVSTKFTGDKINLGDYNANITKVDASVFNKTIKIFGNKNNNLILSGKGSDYLSGGAGTDKIAGNAGNDVISGGTGNNSLNGGAGNDTLYSGTGNNTLTGGKGNDVFFYEGGKLLITDYAAGDKIKISGDKISKSEVKQGYVIFTTSGGSISVKGGASKKIALIDKDDKTTSKVYGSTLKVTKSPVTLGAAYINANASSAKIAVMITGNANNNSILGGAKNDTLYGGKGADTLSGGAGNDSLWGGADNDSLWGGKGKDTFIYKPGEGTDTIFDYASGDMLKILKSNGKTGGTFKDSSFGSGKLTLTINGGGKVIFNDVSSSDTFNINGKIHTISGKKLK